MDTIRKSRFLLALCVLMVALSACGGGSDAATVATNDRASTDSASSDDAANADTEPTDDEPAAVSASESSDRDNPESPIADLLGIPISDDDEMEQYFSELQRNAEVKIAECMRGQGFEYELVDYSDIGAFDADVDFDSREFAEEYGFGIASNPFFEIVDRVEETFVDPNSEYRESLSEGEAAAYQSALMGDFSFAPGDDPESIEPSGCQGAAFDEVFSFFAVFDQFGDELDAIGDAIEADPRVVAATAGWSDCMTEQGYRFGDAEAAEADIQRRYDAILSQPDAYQDETDSEALATEDAPDDVTFFGGQTEFSPATQEQVDALAVEERAMATASFDCNAPLREIADEVQFEYEQKFVDENGAAVRAALGE